MKKKMIMQFILKTLLMLIMTLNLIKNMIIANIFLFKFFMILDIQFFFLFLDLLFSQLYKQLKAI
jgi:hypothetical protein